MQTVGPFLLSFSATWSAIDGAKPSSKYAAEYQAGSLKNHIGEISDSKPEMAAAFCPSLRVPPPQ